MDYITVQQASEKWNVTPRRVQELIKLGRIPDVIRFGRAWMVPKDAPKPEDLRKNNRRRPKRDNPADSKESASHE